MILDRLPPGAIKLDGRTKEWPGTTPATEVIKAGKATATFVAGYDDQGIWLGAEVVKDGPIARTPAFGPNEDCVSLVIAFPRAGVARPSEFGAIYEVGIYAGVPGSSAGLVKFRAGALAGSAIAGAKIVESPRKGGGYEVEAFVPWSAFPEAKRIRAGLRGVMRLYDGDGTTLRTIKASGPGALGAEAALGPLAIEPEQSLPAQTARYEISADVVGGPLNERILVAGRTFTVLGPAFKEGKQWLVVDVGAEISAAEVRDVTADGRADLLLTTRTSSGSSSREALVVYVFDGKTEAPAKVLAHEIAVSSGGSTLRDAVSWSLAKKPTATFAYEAPKGFSVDSYREPIATDVDPILLPWGAVRDRSFVWNGSAFVKDRETAQKPTPATSPTASPTAPPPTAVGKEPLQEDLAAAAIAQFRKVRGIEGPARIETPAVVVPGKRGKIALFGRDLVVATGEGGYVTIGLGRFASERDVIEITARDLTGDGRDELIVRGIVRAKLDGAAQPRDVLREVLLVYAPRPQGAGLAIAPVFAAETARAMGEARVEANFRIVTAKPGAPGRIEIFRGTTKGFGPGNWPFGKEPKEDLEPLLLPWAEPKSVSYGWNGARFAP
jgi:hypothetical protein